MNKYFVYEGSILRAAHPKLWNALKYYKEGFDIFYGNPDSHRWNITKAAKKLIL